MGAETSKVAAVKQKSANVTETSPSKNGEPNVNKESQQSFSLQIVEKTVELQVETEVKKRPVFVPRKSHRPTPLAPIRPIIVQEASEFESESETESEPEEEEPYFEEPGVDYHAWRNHERLHEPTPSSALVKAKKLPLKLVDHGCFTHSPFDLGLPSLNQELKTGVVVAETAVAVPKVLLWDPTVRLDSHEEDGGDDLVTSSFEIVEDVPLPKTITTGDLPPHLLAALQPLLPSNPDQPLYTHPLIHAYTIISVTHPLTSAERLEFLTLLSPSYPLAILCTACHTLHNPLKNYFHPYSPRAYPLPYTNEIQTANARNKELSLSTCPNELRIGHYQPSRNKVKMLPLFPFLFAPAQVQLAVKRAEMGFDVPLSVRSLNWSRIFQRKAWVHLWGVKSKVVDGRFLVRTQHWFMLPAGRKEKDADGIFVDLLRTSEDHQMMDHCLMLCKHQRALGMVEPMLFEKRSKVRGGRLKRKADQTAAFGCTECASEFELRLGVVRGRSVLLVSGWRDLGQCETLEDKRFRSHFWEFDAERASERQSERLNWAWSQMDQAKVMKKVKDNGVNPVDFPKEMQLLGRLAAKGRREKGGERVWSEGGEGVAFVPGSIRSAFEGDESSLEFWVEELDRDGWLKHLETTEAGFYGERILKKWKREIEK